MLNILKGALRYLFLGANYALDYLMPPKCLACSEFVLATSGLCSNCWPKATFISSLYCSKCGRLAFHQGMKCALCLKEPPNYDCARSLMDFNDLARHLIHSFKYQDKLELAEFFGSMLWQFQREFILESHLIVPVPMHGLKLAFRFYNQAQLLAECISKRSRVPIDKFGLRKAAFTKAQAAIGKEERAKNLKSSFALKAKAFAGKSILLVDDVLTTGITASTCAKLLKEEGGASKVLVLTIASVRL